MQWVKRSVRTMLLASAVAATAGAANAAQVVLHNTGGVEMGSDAYRGFRAAAEFWGSKITNDIEIHLNVGFGSLGENILGSTGSTIDTALVQDIYSALAAGATSGIDAQAVAGLQPLGASQYGVGGISMVTPGYTGEVDGVGIGIDNSTQLFDADGSVNNVLLGSTTANLKALGLVTDQSIIDGDITFSSDFNFDFDPTDGIATDGIDFIGVAIHEIGHALGFVSGVDDYDALGLPRGPLAGENCGTASAPLLCSDYPVNDTYWGYTGDLFRYGDVGDGDQLVWAPGVDTYFSLDGSTKLAAFSTGDYNGDGWQASHWKRKLPGADPIGVMDPAVSFAQLDFISAMDFAYFDAIGYNFNFDFDAGDGALFSSADAYRAVPEPSTWALLIGGFGLTGAMFRRRRMLAA